jgi:hypothetical protein
MEPSPGDARTERLKDRKRAEHFLRWFKRMLIPIMKDYLASMKLCGLTLFVDSTSPLMVKEVAYES